MYKAGETEAHFKKWARFLKRLAASRWTTQTYFLFIRYPDTYLFMKPQVAQQGAEICCYDLKYKAEPNWTTYKALLDFGAYLKNELPAYGPNLQPVDMIDVQSFLFCAAQEMYDK